MNEQDFAVMPRLTETNDNHESSDATETPKSTFMVVDSTPVSAETEVESGQDDRPVEGAIATAETVESAEIVDESATSDDIADEPEFLVAETVEPVKPDSDGPDLADPAVLQAALEAVLLVVDTPIAAMDLAQVLDAPRAAVERGLDVLRAEYDQQQRGYCLREVAGGWRLYTRDTFAGYVERYVRNGQQTRLTQAALETLAVVAYRQPVTRARIAAIRGVGVDGVMRTLITRGLVTECGTEPTSNAGLYCTTPLFLEKLGLNSLEELPSLAPLLPDLDAVDELAS